jgi:hypothetical protein
MGNETARKDSRKMFLHSIVILYQISLLSTRYTHCVEILSAYPYNRL